MTRSLPQAVKHLVLGLSFVAAATISGCIKQAERTDAAPAPRSTAQPSMPAKGEPSAPVGSISRESGESSATLFGIQFLRLDFLVPGALGLGIAALLVALEALKRAGESSNGLAQISFTMSDMRKRLDSAESKLELLSNRPKHVDDEFRRELRNLLIRIDRVEAETQAKRTNVTAQSILDDLTPPAAPNPPSSHPPLADLASFLVQPSPSFVIEPQAPIELPAPTGPFKSALIQALNSGDRQPLRAAAKAELNITNDSESAIATGRSLATELEEVSAGGSYWLIELDREHWLFPTDRTLRGFSASQPAKGLFRYESQTIPYPQLIEPVLLESSGSTWIVKSMGVIAIP
jgi:hypothetical protein